MCQISRPPCEWCEFGQVFTGQLGNLYKLGDWKTAESRPMLKINRPLVEQMIRLEKEISQLDFTFQDYATNEVTQVGIEGHHLCNTVC